MVPHPVFLISGLSRRVGDVDVSSCNSKFFQVRHIHNFDTDALVPSSDHCCTETVLPSPCSLPPSLPLSLPPSILPRLFPVSHHRFLPPSRPLLPPSLPPSILPRSCPAPRCLLASCRETQYTLYVYTVLASCTGYCLGRASHAWR